MFDRLKALVLKVVKKPQFYFALGGVFLLAFLWSIIASSGGSYAPIAADSASTPSERVVAAVTTRDPQNIDGAEFVPVSRLSAIVSGPARVTDAAVNPSTNVIAVAVGNKTFIANYLPQGLDGMLADLDAKSAVVSVHPTATRSSSAYGPRGGAFGGATGTPGVTADVNSASPVMAGQPGAAEQDSLYGTSVPAPPASGGTNWFGILMIVGLLAMVFMIVRRSMGAMFGQQQKTGVAGVDNSEDASRPTTKFSDVAGCEEAIEDMEELVDFLRNPARYAAVGAKVPHGALLVGPPGTGKTLLARALAGETGATFIPVSGSDFVEMYVGMGAKRVRGLFSNARKASEHGPVIVFIDEIDAVGRKRSTGQSTNPNTEQEGTLNALLVELDGFTPRDNIIIIGATNRADMLDDALLRPGRMERQIQVPLPNRIGREAILGVHLRNKPLAEGVDLEVVARRTMGFSGAELAALANEAALICVREGRFEITERDLSHATETVAMGKVRKSAIITEKDRMITAWHEAGHAVCGIVQPEGTDVVSISLLPRGNSGGQTWFADGDMAFMTRTAAYARLVTGLGGMAAEQMFFGNDEYTTGPSGDLQQCTNTALAMVAQYGMGQDLLVKDGNLLAAGAGVTDKVIDEAERLLKHALVDAKQLLADNRDFFDRMVAALLDRDTLTATEIEELKAGHSLVSPEPPPAPKRVKESSPVSPTSGDGTVLQDPFGPERKPKRRGRIGRLVGAVSAAWRDEPQSHRV